MTHSSAWRTGTKILRKTFSARAIGALMGSAALINSGDAAFANDNTAPLYNPDAAVQSAPPAVTALYGTYPCSPLNGPGPNAQANATTRAYVDIIQHSTTARTLWAHAANTTEQPVWVCYDNDLPFMGAHHPEKDILLINPRYKLNAQISTIIHELRHWQQEEVNFNHKSLTKHFSNEQYVNFKLLIEADAESLTVQSIWEMKENGHSGPWDSYYNNGQCVEADRYDCYVPIAQAFETAVRNDPQNATNGAAQRAAFYEWYRDDVVVDFYIRDASDQNIPPQNRDQLSPRGEQMTHPMPDHLISEGGGYMIQAILRESHNTLDTEKNYIMNGGGLQRILQQPNAQAAAQIRREPSR